MYIQVWYSKIYKYFLYLHFKLEMKATKQNTVVKFSKLYFLKSVARQIWIMLWSFFKNCIMLKQKKCYITIVFHLPYTKDIFPNSTRLNRHLSRIYWGIVEKILQIKKQCLKVGRYSLWIMYLFYCTFLFTGTFAFFVVFLLCYCFKVVL